MPEKRIGVIVPVYNVEKYVAECIESILAQTRTDFRLILVDDGTPDDAGKICDEYAKKDSRITVIHQDNAGVTRARARGVEEASDCEFITFVDSDDILPPTALDAFTHKIAPDIDIIVASRNDIIVTDNILDARRYRTLIITEKLPCGPVAKLFRRNLFKDNVFEIDHKIIAYEDLVMNVRLSIISNKNVKTIKDVTYIYRENLESASHNFKDNDMLETLLYHSLKVSFTRSELEVHIHDIITFFIHRWDVQFGYNHTSAGWSRWNIRDHIAKDIEDYNYRIGWIEKRLFLSNTHFQRFLLIHLRKIRNCLKQLLASRK